MSLPGNGIFVVQGEMSTLVTAMRRSTRWGSHSFLNEEYDVLMRTFQELKTILNQVDDLKLLDPLTFLSPFLEVIRSKETTGPVTSLALSAIHKFLSYRLIDPTHTSVPATVEDIADAVTHARFVGTDHSSDGVVLMKILQVLRTLMLSPEGAMLTDESVCEIMLSCFRICFETRLTELLRRNAEQCLRDMTQLIFMRLPQFPPEGAAGFATAGLSLKKRDKAPRKKVIAGSGSLERNSSVTEPIPSVHEETNKNDSLNRQDKNLINEEEITIEPSEVSRTKKHGRHSSMDLATDANPSITRLLEKVVTGSQSDDEVPSPSIDAEQENKVAEELVAESDEKTTQDVASDVLNDGQTDRQPSGDPEKLEEYVNQRGIRFTPQTESANLQPYGLTCVRELFRFVISLCNPLDSQNTSAMVHLGLALAGGALEVAADHLARYPDLLRLVQEQLSRHLISLLSTERIAIFALDLQVSFLLFESLRYHLKYQMEAFFNKIIEIISADTTKAVYEIKEIHHLALEYLAQMFRIPGFCTELYVNYDCDVYCNDLFEGLTKLLSQNVVSSSAYNIHTLSLEALMTIIEAIEAAFNQAKVETTKQATDDPTLPSVTPPPQYGRGGQISLELGGMDDASVCEKETQDISQFCEARGRGLQGCPPPELTELARCKNMKQYITRGAELFNSHAERGIEYLQKHGALASPLDPSELAKFLRECPYLDKKMIGEYICKRSSRGEDESPSVLGAFAESFEFAGLRIDQALRHYLETFRLPGEAPLIFLLMERFAERWHTTNGEPFANTDAAFRLAYAIIMLNMDQHNHNAKKLNIPMTVEDFVKNLRGCNGNGDFDQPLLEAIFNAIKSEEMVMPAEQKGAVRDAYLWRVLLRRGQTARYLHAAPAHTAALLPSAAPPTVSALSAAFERAPAPSPEEVSEGTLPRDSIALYSLRGLERCAALTAMCPDHESDVLTVDATLLTLCKFTSLLAQNNYIAIGVTLGQSTKCQLSLLGACSLAARLGNSVRAAWRHLLEIVKALFVGRLLPACLIEAEDYLAPNGMVSLIRDSTRGSEAGLFSSIYSYIALGETGLRAPTLHEKGLIEIATSCVAKCNLPGLLITETKFLQLESLQELIRAMISLGAPPDPESLQMNPQLEDITIFFLELLGQTLIQNRDRVLSVWEEASSHLTSLLAWSAALASAGAGGAARRVLTAQLRCCARLMRSEHCAHVALEHLRGLFELPYKLFYQLSDVISCGLYEVVKTSAQNVHTAAQWQLLLALIAAAGAGAWPRDGAASPAASSRSDGSSDESERRPGADRELTRSPNPQGWIVVQSSSSTSSQPPLRPHSALALARGCEALALVARDAAHVTPHNCRLAVQAVRTFVTATLRDSKPSHRKSGRVSGRGRRRSSSSDEGDEEPDQRELVSLQLLDLMHTLHSRTAQIFKWWRDESEQGQGEEYDLWEVAWMPLLQGIALYCTDKRKQVANSAIAYLQRALLAPGLSAMGGAGWEACFTKVLFPLLETMPPRHASRPRANTILCKVFLHHLSALSPRPVFGALWLRVVSVQESLVRTQQETLTEAALESLKNMLLVMHSVKIFSNGDGYTDLWYMTWEKIGEFLPTLRDELFPEEKDTQPPANLPSHMHPPLPSSLPAIIPVPSPASAPSILPYNPQSPPPHAPQTQYTPMTQNSSQMTQNMSQTTLSQATQNMSQANPNMSQTTPNISHAQATPNMTQASPIINQTSPNMSHTTPTTPNDNQKAQTLPSTTMANQTTTLPPSYAPSILSQNLSQTLGSAGHSPIIMSQSPSLVTPVPVSGMVPIRNPLYSQGGLASSVLLQPLNEMVSTPIGVTKQQMPILCPTEQKPKLDTIYDEKNGITEQCELYSEYLNNPYNERKESQVIIGLEDQGITESIENVATENKSLFSIEQKSFSENCSPLHAVKKDFGSTDNLKQESGRIFNFSSYFGSGELIQGSDFDSLMSTQEG